MTQLIGGFLFSLLVTPGAVAEGGVQWDPCRGEGGPDPISLAQLWEESEAEEPGLRAIGHLVAAEEAAGRAVGREWIPQLSLASRTNWGQHMSPREERILGEGVRGDLRLEAIWTFLDSGRRWRRAEATSRAMEAEATGRSFLQLFRSEVAGLWVESMSVEALWAEREAQVQAFQELAEPVRQRMESGVDATWEVHLLEEALARLERLLADASQLREGVRAELSGLVGRCVRAAPPVDGAGGSPGLDPVRMARTSASLATGVRDADLAGDHPEVQRLLRQADAQDALSAVELRRDRWRLQLVGITGPTRSRAFEDGGFETEYLVGIGGSWLPDFRGVQRQIAAAEAARAGALRAQAESRRQALTRELDRIVVELDHAGTRAGGLERELQRTERRLEVALLRWQSGMDRWTEVMQAQDQAHAVRLLQIELTRDVALALIRYGDGVGDLSIVSRALQEEASR